MKKLLLFAMVLATVAMTSCSKSSSTPTLVGKWNIASLVTSASGYTDTYTGVSTDYADFKSNGTVTTFVDGELSTSSYSVSGTNAVIDGVDYTITTLTTSAATLYHTEGTGSSRFQVTINLRK
jgi:hypothetical protein